MDKEKEIQEMYTIMRTHSNEKCKKCVNCDICQSERLYDAGYRKAKDILTEIGNEYMGLSFDLEEMYARDFGWCKKLFEKYDIEVK